MPDPSSLAPESATTFAEWFAVLADPTRVRVLHAVASHPSGATKVGDVARMLDISQPTASHHVRKLADEGFLVVDKVGTSSMVSVNPACCTGLPHAADVVMGSPASLPCCPSDLPDDVSVRAMTAADLDAVGAAYAEGVATRNATFQTEARDPEEMWTGWLPDHRWVAEVDGAVVGWSALSPTSSRECYRGVAETQVYISAGARGRGVGKSLLHRLVTAADAATDDGGVWTLTAAIFPENRASIALHRSAGFGVLGVRSRVAQLDGIWRDVVLMERRRDAAFDRTLEIVSASD